jgi:predicted  nucleic acid-binding Zn-ribbon protein
MTTGTKVIYKCTECGHIYSIHLTKKCPKCKNIYVDAYINIGVKINRLIDHIQLNLEINKNADKTGFIQIGSENSCKNLD